MGAACDVFTLNAGNTHTQLVGWRPEQSAVRLEWSTNSTPPACFSTMLRAAGSAPVVLAGVVPSYKKRLLALLRESGCKTFLFRKDLKLRIEIIPRPPERVGDDRIAAAMGALALDSKRSWVIVDVGTAMTINAVTPGRGRHAPCFQGGLIVPGTLVSLKALSASTAQLPDLAPRYTADRARVSFIGRSTEEAMMMGVRSAQIAAAIALAKSQMRELGARTRVALTGGGAEDAVFRAEFLTAFPQGVATHQADLVHIGLFSTWCQAVRAFDPRE